MAKPKDIAVVGQPDLSGMVLFAPEVRASLDISTPASERERLPGKDFEYVRVGWMRRRMEEAFPLSWDVEFFETANAETLLKAKAIVVKARVTVRHPSTRQVLIVKEAFGGTTVKFLKGTSDPVDLGNDYKSAQADAMKKALSLFGISADVYEPVIDKREAARDAEEEKQAQGRKALSDLDPEAPITKEVWDFIMAEAVRAGVKSAVVLDYMKTQLKREKPSQLLNKEVPEVEKFIKTGVPF